MSVFERKQFGKGKAGYRAREALAASILLWSSHAGGPRLPAVGAPLLGGELSPSRKPHDSVWWVTPTGQPVKIGDDLSRLKKTIRKDLKAVGMDSPATQLARKRWARAGIVAGIAVLATVAIVVTAGIASGAIAVGAGGATATTGGTLGAAGVVKVGVDAASNAKDLAKTAGKSGKSAADIARSIGSTANTIDQAYGAVQSAIPPQLLAQGEQTAAAQADATAAALAPSPLLVAALAAGVGFAVAGPVGAVIGAAAGYLGSDLIPSE